MADSNVKKLINEGVLLSEHANEFTDAQKDAISKLSDEDVDHLVRIRRETDHSGSGGKPIAMYL